MKIKNVELYLNFTGDWKPNRFQVAEVTKLIFERNPTAFFAVDKYPIAVQIFREEADTVPLCTGFISEQKSYSFGCLSEMMPNIYDIKIEPTFPTDFG